jgi:asparagine synthase (glutamine-hydrolysing)
MDTPSFRDSISAATDFLAHRGPDDAGLFFDDEYGIGLGHRRLSIIDLSDAGHQPMQSQKGDAVIVYNGEIYNFKTIRLQLQETGHQFTSNSDTEVILKAYQQWGARCLDRFVGMFAFAIWDKTSQTLFIARDRLGIKPLYYFFNGHTLLFGSELKALMAFSRFPRDVDPDAFQLYLHYQYVPAPRTIFKNTFKLEPGHFLIFDGKDLTKKRWWTLPGSDMEASASNQLTENEALSQLDDLLTQAVSDRLISDVPLGALLSGGIDSSIVVALMQKVHRSPVRTFSIGFEEKGFNEAPWARKIATHLGTDHTELYVSSQDALRVIPQLPEIYDEPFADSSAIPTFLVSKLTRDQVTVALSGDGGDEQFAGYVRYWMTETMALWMKWLPVGVRHLLKHSLGKIPVSTLSQLYSTIRDYLPQRLQVENFSDKWQKLISQMPQTELAEIYRTTICIWPENDIRRITGHVVPRSTYENVFKETGHLNAIFRAMRVDQHTYLPDAMLTKVDRASMAVSLEIRVPLLDHRVVAFTAQLPEHLKYRNGKGKYLLTELLGKYVPRELVERPKMGFGVPIAQWFRKELKDLINDFLSPSHLQREGRLDPSVVSEVIKEHMCGANNHQHRLWSLLMWEMWRECWL